jgi:isopropylmalate/homocitrate/citramalate synthase
MKLRRLSKIKKRKSIKIWKPRKVINTKKNSISQINISTESLVNRVKQVENRGSGKEDKVEELDETVKDHERMRRKYEWNMQDFWDTMKRPNL